MTVRVAAVMTCFNRKEKTINSIKQLSMNKNIEFTFIVVDDNSSDGTDQALNEMKNDYKIIIKKGNGSSFYTGGMRIGLKYLLEQAEQYDYVLLFNDDVEFYKNSVYDLVEQEKKKHGVMVGVCCGSTGTMTYGAVKYLKGMNVKYTKMPLGSSKSADTFCANCVLIPWAIFKKTGNMDEHYSHSFGDFDYGFSIRREGFNIFTGEKYVGVCDWNGVEKTWRDSTLPRITRLKKKESVKGLPRREWFYYLHKNFGITKAIIFSITPYIKLIMGK